MTARAGITIIVPAYNAAATLEECLRAVNTAKSPQDEVILYDDGSTDATVALAEQAGVRILHGAGSAQGPAHGRNEAARHARCGRLLFVDADVILHPHAIDRLSRAMNGAPAAAAFGSYDDRPRSARATSLYANLRHHFVHQHGRREATTFWSGIGMIDRDVFLRMGGYDKALFKYPSIEDVELGMRLIAAGERILLVPDAQGTHWKDWTVWRVWHTDVVRRALPWSRLIADGEAAAPDLNLARRERFRAALALAVPLLLILGLFHRAALPPAGMIAAIYLWENRAFFGFLRRHLPLGKFLTAVGMQWCYHIYASVTFAGMMLATRLGLRRRHVRTPLVPLVQAESQ